MFPRFWRSNQIILSAISGGSLEKLTRAVTYWRAICFLRFRFLFFCRGEVFRVFWGVPGFWGVFLVFLRVFLVFWGCSWFFLGVSGFSGVSECFVMFRCSGVPCSCVPGSTTCRSVTQLISVEILKCQCLWHIYKPLTERLLSLP